MSKCESRFLGSIVAVVVLAFSSVAVAQDAIPGLSGVPQRPTTLYDKLNAAGGKAGPAPRRDLSGSWTGPLEPKLGEVPPLTPLGQQRFKLNIPDPFRAHSNDPWGTCDPFGFPRSTTNETRGITFAPVPDRVAIMTQYGRIWRTVWMDGRELPKNVGAKGGPEPRWYGYSVGHWDGDYTLVVDTNGVNDKTWIDRRGYPHSVDMRAQERYTRVDHDTLELTVTVDDPKMYTKPFVAVTNRFKWIQWRWPVLASPREANTRSYWPYCASARPTPLTNLPGRDRAAEIHLTVFGSRAELVRDIR